MTPIPIDLTPPPAHPPAERIAIADALYDSASEGELPPRELPEELRAVPERRLRDLEENPDDGIPWEDIKRDALARSKRPA